MNLDILDPATLECLARAATTASKNAYAPYSRFPVGAAVLSGDGKIYSASNVENASYGLSICAERAAIFAAAADGARVIQAVVIFTPTSAPTAPCGACRQVINEFGPDARVHSCCNGPDTLDSSLAMLLPSAFGPGNLSTS